MAPLRLTRLDTSAGPLRVVRRVHGATRGVVLVDIEFGDTASGVPLHWRAGDWRKPPLDIRLAATGALEDIQVVFQDEAVAVSSPTPSAADEHGFPTFDVGSWAPDRYVDVRTAVTATRWPSDHLYVAIGMAACARSIMVERELRLDFDAADRLVGIAVGPLTAEEWRVIDGAAVDVRE